MAAPKIAGTIRSKNPLKGAVEILPVSSFVSPAAAAASAVAARSLSHLSFL